MTVDEWLPFLTRQLTEAGIVEAQPEARILLGHALGKDRAWIVAHGGAEVPDLLIQPLLERRLRREPLAYILGYREFFGRRFAVSPAVLIPRQETETLIEAALIDLGQRPTGTSVLDLGTGSGCIGITLALEWPSARVVLSDESRIAIDVAMANARALEASVTFVRSDAFADLNGTFDLIVSNPPYIAEAVPLMPEVGLFEPEMALYGGETGFEFFERIARGATPRLGEGGTLMVECGDGQADEVTDLFEGEGWRIVERRKDLLDTERVLSFKRAGH